MPINDAAGAHSHQLHKCGINDGTEQTTLCQEHSSHHRPLHKVRVGSGDKRSDCKDCCQVLYERFIVVSGVPTKLLRDHSANFTSALVEELCTTFGIKKCHTTAYHAQCNGQVERFHQMLFQMIGKLRKDKKAQREQHLHELIQCTTVPGQQ